MHIGRVTSSLFGDVMSSGPSPTSLIKQIVEGSNLEKYTNLPAAVQWGIDKEGQAREQYKKIKKAIHKVFEIQPTGLTLCGSHAFLGASSDGKVTEGDNVGVLEIKCPYSLKGTLINKKEIPEIMTMGDKAFCLENTNTGQRLRHSHKYYAQVQGEMAIMGLPWCDFVVWTEAEKNNICIERINFDASYVTKMMPKLLAFYMEHIYPFYYK
ncbi:hypothetical protein LOTGIDRAFT_160492 [Lottia gigantea]|uniref:YqaJ viral recombinase domain-containing protein n=1 Tax=Lottia gigantea TaxID=225164 RepID=V4AKX4_LOTGI|nr:hypothetical protein LOTGIDRAFT_160492 [Lottia gigantea]ESO95360.1 hypothetical protein LOTGIDRAFT_160492 [Lottia gigantea]